MFIVAAILFLPPWLWKVAGDMVAPDASRILRKVWVEDSKHCKTRYFGRSTDDDDLEKLSDIRTSFNASTAAANSTTKLGGGMGTHAPSSTGRFDDV